MSSLSPEKLLERARVLGTPLIEDDSVTFVWSGKHPPYLMGDFTDWEGGSPVEMTPFGSDVWIFQASFPRDAYLEYIFVQDGIRLNDPFNPRRVWNGVGQYNHYFYMPAAHSSPLLKPLPPSFRGIVTRHSIPTLKLAVGRQRSIYLYQPPVEQPSPLVLVLDGYDYLRRAHLTHLVDNLIALHRIRPIALAFIGNAGSARLVEYGCSEAFLAFMMRSVLPLAHQHLNLLDPPENPGSYGVIGASMGGLMALYTGLRFPQIFGNILTQSGAFAFPEMDLVVFQLARCAADPLPRVFIQVGKYDFSGFLQANQRMYSLLLERGHSTQFHIYSGGHNFTSWRDHIAQGLEFCFGFTSASQ